MKKIVSVLLPLMMLLSFNVKAVEPTTLFFVIGAGFNEATKAKYEACNNKPYRTVSRKGTNFYFDVNECDYQKYKENYKLR